MSNYRRSRGTKVSTHQTKAEVIKLVESVKDPDGKGISWGFDNADCALLLRYSGVPFRLKVNIEAKFETIKGEYRRMPSGGWDKVRKQAEREAWRNLLDLLKLNITMIHEKQFRFTDLFLAFVELPGPGKTFSTLGDYFLEQGKLEAIASGRLALPEPKE